MLQLIKLIKYRKQIIGLLRYSLGEVHEYKYLTKKEKEIVTTPKVFHDLKAL